MVNDPSAALLQALGAPQPAGGAGFRLLRRPGAAVSAPALLLASPGRARAVAAWSARLPPPGGRDALARLATALRQEIGRDLAGVRALAPAAEARFDGDAVTLTAFAAFLDGAAAAPGTLDALRRIFQDERRARWTAWAARG